MYKYKIFNFIALLLLLTIAQQCNAIVPIFNELNNQDILISKNIRTITQDHSGFIWIGTTSGLYKYDGYDLSEVSVNNASKINIIFVDNQGVVWVGTDKFGLYKLTDNTFKPFEINSISASNSLSIFDITQDKNGNIWLATDNGLKYITSSKDISESIHKKFEPFKSIQIHSLETISDNKLLIGVAGSFHILNIEKYSYETHKIQSIDAIIHDFLIDNNNNIWIATSKGLLKFSLKLNDFIKSPLQSIILRATKLIEYNNQLWVATIRGGIFNIDLQNNNTKNIRIEENHQGSLRDASIYTLFVSKGHILWVGSFRKGIDLFNLKALNFGYERNSVNSIHCKEDNSFPSVFMDSAKTLWIGIYDGIIKYTFDGDCQLIDIPFGSSNVSESVLAIQEFEQFLWMLTKNSIISYNKISGTIERVETNIGSYPLLLLKSDNTDDFYIGTNEGLYVYSTKTKQTKLVENTDRSFTSVKYSDYYKDSNDLVYFATANGLTVLNHEKVLSPVVEINRKLENKNLTAVFKTKNNFYLGVKNSGLLSIEKNSEPNHHFSKKLTIYNIIPNKNDLWLATNNGLLIYNKLNNESHVYIEGDGINNKVFYRNSSFKYDDMLVFGGQNGLIKFNPDDIQLQEFNANIVLTQFSLMNKKLEWNNRSESGFILSKPINDLEQIELGYKDYIIGFEFAALDYADSMRNQYAYRLKGLYDDWVYVDANDRKATFTNLSPGDYTFQVKASNKDGMWSDNPKELAIKVYPAPWFSPWAYFTYMLITLLSIWGFIRYKTIASRKRAQQLEVTVEERTQEVNRQKKMVESLLDYKNEVFANITHEFKTPLSLIMGPIDQLSEEAALTRHSDKLNMIQRNAKRLMLMVGQILKLSQAEQDKEVLRESQAIQPILLMLYESFKPLAGNKNINITVENNHDVNVYATSDTVEIVVGNLLSNAVKFTNNGGEISLKSHLSHSMISISVEDTGSGIQENDLNKIFKRFTRLDNHKNVAGTGIGLSVVKEITEANDGEVKVTSQWGVGTTFTVKFPVTDIKPVEDLSQVMVDQLVENTTNEIETNTLPSNQPIVSHKITVLIIEDNIDMQTLIGNVLKSRFNCLFASRGRHGIALALEHVPDIVVCDVMMPGMDGYQVTRILRHDGRTSHIPIVLLTALNTTESRIKGWRENIDTYITKPFDAKELIVQIDNILSIRKLLQQKTHTAINNNDSLNTLDLPEQDLKFIEKLKTVISKLYTNEYIQKADLADKMAVSERQLHRKIKALIDENPMDMLRDYRLEKAKMKLKNGFQVGIVSDECGFSSVSYFGNCFKKKYGVTPKQYQTMNKR
jgi:signal transduction histidine kinase/ligand-binding sensor domain-containing protein/DNA-binding response OmpR family regulator